MEQARYEMLSRSAGLVAGVAAGFATDYILRRAGVEPILYRDLLELPVVGLTCIGLTSYLMQRA
ncbi:MAG: hypothetical protein HY513_01955 [Candidatus Aenigmarchaeota archaeon]|nr:hypothetical protein [Candidatus Aenigmarchaeota archaeon]